MTRAHRGGADGKGTITTAVFEARQDMSDHDDPQYRAYHHPDADRVTVRETDEDGTFSVRMPLASTGEVRNQGDDPLSREELDGMRQQIEEQAVGVFLDHGSNMDIGGSRYSAVGKVGEWADPDLVEGEGDTTLLEADARLMDPETLPEATGTVREALAVVKSQADRDLALSSSIGWRDDESFAGGVDLMEASIVGIPADPRTTSQDAPTGMARAVVMGPDGQRHLSDQQAEIAERLVDAYRDQQGDGSVENFEDWLWTVAYYDFDENEFHAAQTALQEFYRATTPLEDPVSDRFVPFLDAQREDGSGEDGTDDGGTNGMTDTDSDADGGDPDGTNDGGSDGMDDQEFRETMLELQREQTETLSVLSEAVTQDAGDDVDEANDAGGGDGGTDGDTQNADTGDDDGTDGGDGESRTVEVDGKEMAVDEVVADHRESLRALREGGVDLADIDFEQDVALDEDADVGTEGGDTETDRDTTDDEPTASSGWLG